MPCAACRGPLRPLPPIPSWLRRLGPTCSLVCLAKLSMRTGPMEATKEQKQAALKAASKAAGEYIVHTKTYNFQRMTKDQWFRLLWIIVDIYNEKLREAELDDEIPY